MEKSVFLLVHGDGDYGAMYFENNFDERKVYKEMLEEGVTRKTITYDEGYGEEDIYICIQEFNKVDSEFIDFIMNEFLDYDHMKAKNFFRVV